MKALIVAMNVLKIHLKRHPNNQVITLRQLMRALARGRQQQ
jgi:hypothetical protein